MNEKLLELMSVLGFVSRSRKPLTLDSIAPPIFALRAREIRKIVEYAQGVIEYATPSATEGSPFEFSASATFGGAPHPCAGLSCRMERVQELAYFAALYADRVLIPSPFSYVDSTSDLRQLRCDLAVAIAACLYLKPLLCAGVVQFAPKQDGEVCLHCLATKLGNSSDDVRSLLRKLEHEYEVRATYFAEKDGRTVLIIPGGPADLFETHETATCLHKPPDSIKGLVHGRKERVTIPVEIVRELKIPVDYARVVARDLITRDLCASRFGTGYLTRRELDLTLATTTEHGRDEATVLRRNLGHTVETLQGASIKDLLRLRNSEMDAFKMYQIALRKAAVEAPRTRDISGLYSDVVEPEIRRMNLTLQSARRSLLRSLTAHVAGASVYAGIALYSGLVSPSVAGALAAFGGGHFTKKIIAKVAALYKQEPPDARENPFYFLWKASRLAQ